MRNRLYKFFAIALSAAMLFTGMPAQLLSTDGAAATVFAAVAKPADVKISLKRVSDSQVTMTASWSGSTPGFRYVLSYENGFGGLGKLEGVTTDNSASYTFSHPEGQLYTYKVEVKGMDGNNGPYSSVVTKTKSYMNTGTYTKKIKSLVKKKTNGMSKYEKIRFAHDWLVKNVDYDTDYDMVSSTTLKGLYKNKKAVCQGYAIAFGVFMKYMDIPSKYVVSKNKNHMWNMVKLDGKWYHVDVTWDDPVGIEDVTKNHPAYDYFLQSSKNFRSKSSSSDHKFNAKNYPKATSTLYDNDGSKPNYSESVPGDDSVMCGNTFSPWKNGKKTE